MASREDVRRMALELLTCSLDLSALETGESGVQEKSLLSGDSLCLALPALSVGLEDEVEVEVEVGGLEPRLLVEEAPPWRRLCGRVGLP